MYLQRKKENNAGIRIVHCAGGWMVSILCLRASTEAMLRGQNKSGANMEYSVRTGISTKTTVQTVSWICFCFFFFGFPCWSVPTIDHSNFLHSHQIYIALSLEVNYLNIFQHISNYSSRWTSQTIRFCFTRKEDMLSYKGRGKRVGNAGINPQM